MSAKRLRVYTDGACLGNPGPGGWAWAISELRYGCGGVQSTTNQRMELKAVIEALKSNRGPLVVVTDSAYVFNCFEKRWWEQWIENGFRTSRKREVANRDLWMELIDLYLKAQGQIAFEKIEGHSGDRLNDFVDRLARAKAREILRATGRIKRA